MQEVCAQAGVEMGKERWRIIEGFLLKDVLQWKLDLMTAWRFVEVYLEQGVVFDGEGSEEVVEVVQKYTHFFS